MALEHEITKNLFRALDIAGREDRDNLPDAPPVPTSLLAALRRHYRRIGDINGVICRIEYRARCYALRSFQPGNWQAVEQRDPDEDLEDDVHTPKRYELIDLGAPDDGNGPEQLHLIRGMVSAEEADQFFDQSFHKAWITMPMNEIGEPNGSATGSGNGNRHQ